MVFLSDITLSLVRGSKLLVSGEFNFKVENCFGFLNMPLSGLDGKGGLA